MHVEIDTAVTRMGPDEEVAFLRTILDSAIESSIIATDLDGTILAWNAGARRLYGYEAADVLGKSSVFVLHHAADVTSGRAQAILDEVRRTGIWSGELARVRADRTPFTANVTITLRRDAARREIGFTLISRELSVAPLSPRDRQGHLRGLNESNWGFVEIAPDGVVIIDREGRILVVNSQTERLFGYVRADLLLQPVEILIPERYRDRHPGHRHGYFRDPRIRAMGSGLELRGRRKDGTEFPIEISLSPLETDEGTLVLSSIRDVSERHRMEEARFRLAAIVDSSDDAIIGKDLGGIITSWNGGAQRLLGYTAEEAIGSPVAILFPPGREEDESRLLERLARGERVGSFDTVRRRKNGTDVDVSVTLSPVRNGTGVIVGASKVARDITERKRSEHAGRELAEQNRRVQEATRLKSEFLANMSHELRTPLNGIIGFAEILHDGRVGPIAPEHKEFLGDILTSAHHLLALINDVLDLSKVESGKMDFRPEPVDLATIVGEVCDIVRTLTASKGIRVEVDVDPELTGVITDPSKLKQVLYNYLSNALKFTPDGGQVRIRVAKEASDMLRIDVEDTGIGIRKDDLGRLFVEFQQLDAGSAKRYQGTGLGLALTRRIAEAQGGHVEVRSELGVGSTFSAILPRVAGDRYVPPPPEPAPAEGASVLRILVVDDDAGDRADLLGGLARAGCAVETAETGAEAIARAAADRFDAITLDLTLPDATGWDVLHAIRATGPNQDTPVIVVTALAAKGAPVGFLIHDFLTKPVDPAVLVAALERAGVKPDDPRSVLLVDDDPDAGKGIADALADRGHRLFHARGGHAGLRAATANPPCAVLLDLVMPDLDGTGFLERFRLTDAGRTTPVIVCTAKDLSAAERAALRDTAQAIVVKGPAVAAALLAEVATLASGRAPGGKPQ